MELTILIAVGDRRRVVPIAQVRNVELIRRVAKQAEVEKQAEVQKIRHASPMLGKLAGEELASLRRKLRRFGLTDCTARKIAP